METGERADEVLKHCVLECPVAAVGFDHHHLVGRPGVDITIENIADIGVCPEGADGTATAPVTVDVLNQDIVRWALLVISISFFPHIYMAFGRRLTLTVTHSSLFVTSI